MPDAYCQCGPGHPANGTWCYICELPAQDDGGYAEFAAALEAGEPFVFCLTCRHIALDGHNCLAVAHA